MAEAAAEHRPYRTRTSVLFAADAPKAVILRRGPRTHYHLIAWDTATDTSEPGETREHAELTQALLAAGLQWVDWIGLRSGDDLLFAGDGRIFRVGG
jgi:hypothetical protein